MILRNIVLNTTADNNTHKYNATVVLGNVGMYSGSAQLVDNVQHMYKDRNMRR